MSGDRSAKDRIDEFAANVEEYSRQLGLLSPAPRAQRVADYLGMNPDEIDDLSDGDLAKMAIDVNAYLCGLEEQIGIQRGKIVKCKLQISKIVEGVLDEYGDRYMKVEDKRLAAIFDSETARQYYEIQQHAEAFVQRWDRYGYRLESFAKSLQNKTFARNR